MLCTTSLLAYIPTFGEQFLPGVCKGLGNLDRIAMKICTENDDPHRMNLTDFGDPQTSPQKKGLFVKWLHNYWMDYQEIWSTQYSLDYIKIISYPVLCLMDNVLLVLLALVLMLISCFVQNRNYGSETTST